MIYILLLVRFPRLLYPRAILFSFLVVKIHYLFIGH